MGKLFICSVKLLKDSNEAQVFHMGKLFICFLKLMKDPNLVEVVGISREVIYQIRLRSWKGEVIYLFSKAAEGLQWSWGSGQGDLLICFLKLLQEDRERRKTSTLHVPNHFNLKGENFCAIMGFFSAVMRLSTIFFDELLRGHCYKQSAKVLLLYVPWSNFT